MKNKNTYDITLPDDDLLLLCSPAFDLPAASSPKSANKSEVSSASYLLIQSILDKMYKRESDLPYLFVQWVD